MIRDLAAAELGAALFDEHGTFRFLTAATIADLTGPAQLRSDENLGQFGWSVGAEQVYDAVVVPWTTLTVDGYNPAGGVEVWSYSEPFTLDANTVSRTMVVDLPDGVVPPLEVALTVSTGTVTVDAVEQHRPGRVRIRLGKALGAPATVDEVKVTAGGTITADRSTSVEVATGADVGQTLELSGNPWRQSPALAEQVAGLLAVEVATPRPSYRQVQVWPDPRRQLADPVELSDQDVSGVELVGVVAGIRTAGGPDGLAQTLTVRPYPQEEN